MSNSELVEFVRASLTAGASRSETQRALRDAGWPDDQVNSALAAFADTDFVIPVPVPKVQLSARDAFLYLIMFGMLYVSAYHFGGLIFDFINLALPDPVNAVIPGVIGASIRFSIASLVVAFPIFMLTAMRITRLVTRDPVHRNSAIRKWLTYLTLVAAAFILAGDLIYTLYNLLSGELTLRFFLKALTIATIAGGLFWYFFQTMRTDDEALEG